MDKIQITSLKDEGTKEEMNAADLATSLPNSIVHSSTQENRKHTIPDFLNRYHVLDQFDWTITNTVGSVLRVYRFPDRLNAIISIRNKFSNFYGMRAGVELVVQVNSQPFQQGNLLISYLPNARYSDVKNATHAAGLQGMVTRSGAPRVNLDLMDATRADLTVPYASPFIYYNLLTNEGTIGDFHISVYGALRDVAAGGKVTVTVAARFVDIDLAFPTGSSLPAQGVFASLIEKTDRMHVAPSRESIEAAKKELNSLLKRIDDGNFSFQMNTNATCMKQQALPHMATSDSSNLTHVLSTTKDNSLKPLSMGNTSSDDMSFKEIMSIPCFHDRVILANTVTSGTNIWSKNVTPLLPATITNTDGSISADYVYFISNMFKKWRGSIKYKFRVVKTKFHSLRLRVSFAPGASAQLGIDRDSCYSEIIDLRDNNTFEFTVPYINPNVWLNTRGTTTSLGLLMLDVHNQMVAPSSVANEIDIIVERCSGPDFELAIPSSMQEFPFDPTVLQARKTVTPPKIVNVVTPAPENRVEENKNSKEIFKNESITRSFVNSMQNLPARMREYLVGAATRDPSRFLQSTIAALNQYAAMGVEISYDMLTWQLSKVLAAIAAQRIILAQRPHHIELRSIPDGLEISTPFSFQMNFEAASSSGDHVLNHARRVFNFQFGDVTKSVVSAGYLFADIPWYIYFPGVAVAEILVGALYFLTPILCANFKNPFKKDLTIEGIEPNPGPATSFELETTTFPNTYTSPYFGPQKITFIFSSKDTFSNTIRFSAPGVFNYDVCLSQYATYHHSLYWNDRSIPVIEGTIGLTGLVRGVITFDTNLNNDFSFQMKDVEQDNERGGNNEACVTQPAMVSNMAQFCMGASISNVNQMISRSTRFSTISPSDSRMIHMMSHGIGISGKDANGLQLINGVDNISYFASLYAFARGGVNFRLVTTGAPYRILMNPNNDISQTSTEVFDLVEQIGVPTVQSNVRSANLMQQAINTSVEGFGEFAVPFLSSTFCYSISPSLTYEPTKDVVSHQLPDTHTLLDPQGNLSDVITYRNALPDFQMSFLTGPPLLLAIT